MLSRMVRMLIKLLRVRVACLCCSGHVRRSIMMLHHLGVMGSGCRIWRRSLWEMADLGMSTVALSRVLTWLLAIVIVVGGILLWLRA